MDVFGRWQKVADVRLLLEDCVDRGYERKASLDSSGPPEVLKLASIELEGA